MPYPTIGPANPNLKPVPPVGPWQAFMRYFERGFGGGDYERATARGPMTVSPVTGGLVPTNAEAFDRNRSLERTLTTGAGENYPGLTSAGQASGMLASLATAIPEAGGFKGLLASLKRPVPQSDFTFVTPSMEGEISQAARTPKILPTNTAQELATSPEDFTLWRPSEGPAPVPVDYAALENAPATSVNPSGPYSELPSDFARRLYPELWKEAPTPPLPDFSGEGTAAFMMPDGRIAYTGAVHDISRLPYPYSEGVGLEQLVSGHAQGGKFMSKQELEDMMRGYPASKLSGKK